jgi:cell wall-associated NlpC family hydrolase
VTDYLRISASVLPAVVNVASTCVARPGDLVFYNMQVSRSPTLQHVTVYMGRGNVIQGGGVRPNVNIATYTQLPNWEFRRLY